MWSSRRPASLRAVTIVSSSPGWRSTSDAQSAPAKPAAPSTATLFTPQTPGDSLEPGLDRVTRGGNVLVGEGAIGGAERQPQRQRLAAGGQLVAAVDVE